MHTIFLVCTYINNSSLKINLFIENILEDKGARNRSTPMEALVSASVLGTWVLQ
jgi:hypothetical protein